MDIKEKLRLAALQAETEAVALIPPDSEIDWTPSEAFNEKMNELIEPKPKKRLFTIRRLSIFAAAVAVLAVFCIPVFMNSSENTDGDPEHIHSGAFYGDHDNASDIESGYESDILGSNGQHTSDISNSDSPDDYIGEDISGDYTDGSDESPEIDDGSVPCDDKYADSSCEEALPPVEAPKPFFYEPGYLPEGYTHSDSAVTQYFVVRTYSNGTDAVRLYYINGEADFSVFDGTRNNYNNLDYYSKVPMSAYFIIDESTHELKEYIFFPDGVEWNQNNVAWNNSGMTFAIMGNENISQEEIEKIAASVNLEPKELTE